MNCSEEVGNDKFLDAEIKRILDKAIERARQNRRKTVFGKDL